MHLYNGIQPSHNKDEIMPFAATWMDIEIIILSEISQKKEDKYYMISHADTCVCLCVYPMNCSSLGSSFQGTLQSGILNRVAISFSRVFSQARDLTQVSCIAGRFFTLCATWEACIYIYIYSCCSVAQLCLPLWDTTDCSTPGSPAHHHLLELA